MLFIKRTSPSISNISRNQRLTPNQYIQTFQTKQTLNMPLVVPGINSGGDSANKTEEWMNKLVGKKIGETSDSVVSICQSQAKDMVR